MISFAVLLLSSSCSRDATREGRGAASEVSPTSTAQDRPTLESEDATVFVLGRWSAAGNYPGLVVPSLVDSDADNCPEVLISTGSGGSHLVHGHCSPGSTWTSARVAEPGEWASLVALRQRRHALVKQRHTKLEISCGALSEGRWQHEAGSAVSVEPRLRPVLLTSVPAELFPARPSFVILDDFGSLI